jgi:demethylmenaquinone methyltransferase/2-methoxy-6-polyprenyl-1,4-benzoquinol methylase
LRADEYDGGSYQLADPTELAMLIKVIAALPARYTLDLACGTGWLSRFLRGSVVGLDQSDRMLTRYRQRSPHTPAVRADVPPLPFADDAFELCFAAHFISHLQAGDWLEVLAEAKRVAAELVIVEQQLPAGHPGEGWERRALENGDVYRVYKRYRTARELAGEIGGDVLHDSRDFLVVRWSRPS